MSSSDNYSNEDTVSIDTFTLEKRLEDVRTKELTKLKALSKNVCNLHTNILYYRNTASKRGALCFKAWNTLITKIGGTSNLWRDIGRNLGVSEDHLNYIQNSVQKEAQTDVVLQVYLQNENATLDNIVNALEKVQRYDILKAIEEPFCDLGQEFNQKDDSGYQSADREKGPGKKKIICNNNFKENLPPVLSDKCAIESKSIQPHLPPILPAPITEFTEMEDHCPFLFLTYAEDGFETALNIKNYLSKWDEPKVVALTLSDRKEKVYQNPERFIREYFEKAEFVVPILTKGYLDRIKHQSTLTPDTNDDLDYKYVNFIYKLIISYYIHGSGCLNNKVRSVLPLEAREIVREIDIYPDLLPFTLELNFSNYFKAFLKK